MSCRSQKHRQDEASEKQTHRSRLQSHRGKKECVKKKNVFRLWFRSVHMYTVHVRCTQGVFKMFSLRKPGPCWEQTQHGSNSNWLLIYTGTAGLISWQTVGGQASKGGGLHLFMRLKQTPTYTIFVIFRYFSRVSKAQPCPMCAVRLKNRNTTFIWQFSRTISWHILA